MDFKIVGLDLGKQWGWATLAHSEGLPPVLNWGDGKVGSDAVNNASSGMIYYTFSLWLRSFLDTEKPSLLVFESVRFHRGVTYIDGQKGILLAMLEARETPYYGLPIKTLKQWGGGTGMANKGQMIQAVKDRWDDPAGFAQDKKWRKGKSLTSDMADALWCAHHGWVAWS